MDEYASGYRRKGKKGADHTTRRLPRTRGDAVDPHVLGGCSGRGQRHLEATVECSAGNGHAGLGRQTVTVRKLAQYGSGSAGGDGEGPKVAQECKGRSLTSVASWKCAKICATGTSTCPSH